MKLKTNNTAVVEFVGAILLMAMAVSVFSVVYYGVLTDEGPSEKIYTTITGHLEELEDGSYLVFESEKGESLSPEDIINVRLANSINQNITVGELTGGDLWNLGEKIKYKVELDNKDAPFVQVYTNIVNRETNSMVFYGILRDGYSVPSGSFPFPFNFNPQLTGPPGNWYTAKVDPIDPYIGKDVILSSVHICNINGDPIVIWPIESPYMQEQNLMLKFTREDLEIYVNPGPALIVITGNLTDGNTFEFFDIVNAQ